MEPVTHESVALYAVGVLDAPERLAFEEHLAGCETCGASLASFSAVLGALALDSETITPPPSLRARILAEVDRQPRSEASPPRDPRVFGLTVIVLAAIGVAIFVVARERQANAPSEQAAVISGAGLVHRVSVVGTTGVLAISREGKGVLILSRLGRAPAGRSYEAWLIHGHHATMAAVFLGGTAETIVPLSGRIDRDAVVAVSWEQEGGASQPRGPLLFAAAPRSG
jgi:anti-sigma-K factor RskA